MPDSGAQQPGLIAAAARGLRAFQKVPGWARAVEALVPYDPSQRFVVENQGTRFAGSLGSHIERAVYLFGGYEPGRIRAFLDVIPKGRRRCLLDVGANIGTHSLALARHFDEVHSFEPNMEVFEQLSGNLKLNPTLNITPHPVGLADREETLDFYLTERANTGVGTFSPVEQYDVPLIKAGQAKVVQGDQYLAGKLDRPVDAIKIDTQGFEPEVLRGMPDLLARNRPFIWFEVSPPTFDALGHREQLAATIPYPFSLRYFAESRWRTRTVEWTEPTLIEGDFIVVPAGD